MPIWRTVTFRAMLALLLVVPLGILATNANAGLFSKIFREAADSAGKGTKLPGKLSDLDVPADVARVVTGLPEHAKKRALISEATPEGHVRLTNVEGETVTASTTEEVNAALKWLVPDSSDSVRRNVDFYFSTDALENGRPALNTLPRSARAHIIHKDRSYPVVGSPPFETKALRIRLRAGIVVRATGENALTEAIWQIDQPLKASQVRVVSLDPASQDKLQTVRTGAAADVPEVETVNPYDLAKTMRGLNRQTVIISGKIDGKVLYFTPPSGNTQSVLLADLRNAASRDDVNLIFLNTDNPRQPGVRNLLLQRTRVEGLDQALNSKTVGEFWSTLVSRQAPLELDVSPAGATYVSVSATPNSSLSRQLPEDDQSLLSKTGRIFENVVSNVSGNIITSGIEASLRSESHEQELRLRIIPGIPSAVQILYLLALFVGLFGLAIIRDWWRKLWPLRERASFVSTLGWLGNRLLRAIPFLFVFMPLVAFIATPYQMVRGPIYLAWRILSAPFRWMLARNRAA